MSHDANADLQHIYQQVCRHAGQTALLESIEAVLGWDERTMLPTAGAEYRAEQMTLLSGMVHQRWTDRAFGESLAELSESRLVAPAENATSPSDAAATIRRLKRQRDKKIRLPQSLVEELTRTTVLGQHAWQEARSKDDFLLFRPLLEKIIDLKRQEADALGYAECRYDALLDDYEPEESTANVARVLAGLRGQLAPLVAEIAASGRRPDVSLLQRPYPLEAQAAFGREAAAAIGFDFHRGRLDVTAHPFCSGMGPHDCRITTRYDAGHFNAAFFGILHEAGHGIYEQGLREDQYGLPLGSAVSLGIHESQSRLWENMVGRSRSFWEHFFGKAQGRFPQALGDVSLDDFCFAINDVRPSLIRVEADEATYNLHILIRFELERALLDGDLAVADLPGAWNERYQKDLGIAPPGAAQGVLQDIHWSAGLIGYFPTYALGNLYAAQFFAQADAELGGLDRQFARGEFQPLRQWLREKIHQQGQRHTAAELVEQVTGRPLSPQPLMAHLRAKLGPLYGIG